MSDKLDLIDKIGRALQAKYTFDQLETFLAACTPPARQSVPYNSKRLYSREALRGIGIETLLEIAQELDIEPGGGASTAAPPRNWKDTKKFRLFISHLAKDKAKAMRLRECLEPYAISGFVAHEDIHPTLEWQHEIERALKSMDAFIAIHTSGFSSACKAYAGKRYKAKHE